MGKAEEVKLVLELMKMKPSLTAQEAAAEIKTIRQVLAPPSGLQRLLGFARKS
jgi:hypothetical protein